MRSRTGARQPEPATLGEDPTTARLAVFSCLGGLAYIALFATIDALLEVYVETTYQMLIRLVLVSTALTGAIVLLMALAHRVRAAQEKVRLVQEQAEQRVQAAQEEAGLQRALLTLHVLAQDAPDGIRATTPARNGPAPAAPAVARQTQVAVLTPREREIAVLIAQGRTSREIAQALVITERTADTHADHIRTKLGLRSRAEIGVWVLSQGLLSSTRRPS
jgi:DNA-binding CsgD family transcriptional regulator